MVREMMILGIFKFMDVDDIPSTKRSAPFIKRKNPIITEIIYLIILSTFLLY